MAVICKFGGQKELVPVILLVVNEELDKLLHFLVDPLGLAVGLQVVGRGHCWYDANEAPELCSELCDELRSPVGDVLLQCAMGLLDVLVIQLGGAKCIEPGGALNEVHTFTENTSCDHDGIVAMGLWKFNNEVQKACAPTFLWNLGGV